MPRSRLLFVDALINLVLGLLLMAFPEDIIAALGAPMTAQAFYPSMLGAVLFGIGLALMMEYGRKPESLPGLGLGGAAAINLCAGLALAAWLAVGALHLPTRGLLLLWGICFVLVVLSLAELAAHRRTKAVRG